MLGALAVALGILALPPPWLRTLAAVPVLGAPALDGYHRLLLVVSFALAYLAACTLARWYQGPANERRRGWWVLMIGIAALGLGRVLAWAYLDHANPWDPKALEVLRIGWLHWQGRFLVLGSLVLGGLVLLRGGQRRRLPPAMVLLIAAELVLLHRDVNPPMPPRLAFPPSPPLTFLKSVVEPDGPRMAALGGALPPNLGVLYELADARIYNPVEPADYAGFTNPLVEPPRRNVPRYGEPQSPLWDRLGVGYLLVDAGLELDPPLERVLEDPAGWVYRRSGALPLAYWGPASKGANELAEEGDRPLSRVPAQLEMVEPERWSLRPAPSSLAEPDLDLAALGPLQLRTALYRHPGGPSGGGWRVLRGEERLPTERADGPFLAAFWPRASASEDLRAELVYRPPGFLLGCLLAGLAAAGAALFLCPLPAVLSSPLSSPPASPSRREE
jgi:hypothetical protein